MIVAGIDVGNKLTKVVLLRGGQVIARSSVLTGFDQRESALSALDKAVKEAGIGREDVRKIVATGAGKGEVDFATSTISDVGANAKGIVSIFPSVKTVIDVGAEEGRAIKCRENGKVADFANNEKCAAGAGSFVESMSRALEMSIEEFGPISLKSQKKIAMNAQCTVFAESEVVSLIHAKTPKEDIARAVTDAIANRVTSMVRRIGVEDDLALVGGVALNVGLVRSMEEELGRQFLIPDNPEFICALGAALVAAESADN